MDFKDKIVLIGGAGGAMGRSAAIAYAQSGAKLALCDASQVGLEETMRLIPKAEVFPGVIDVRNVQSIEEWMSQLEEKLGLVDILVNYIGIWHQTPVEQVTEQMWDRVMDINMKGVFFLCQAAMKQMRRKGGGCIINLASAVGETGSARFATPYSASKGGIIAMSKAMAREGAPHIRVNVISPGPVDTPMLADSEEEKREIAKRCIVGRLGTTDDITGAALYLSGKYSGYITGEVLRVNGGSLM
jgi:3-oxoacyl-[acyl-carrier protein] reductase